MLSTMLRKARKLITTRQRPNRVNSVNSVRDNDDRQMVEYWMRSNSSDSKDDAETASPVNWKHVGLHEEGLTNIKNRNTLEDVIIHIPPVIFNKKLIDEIIRDKIIDYDDALRNRLLNINMIYLKNMDMTPTVMRLLEFVVKNSYIINTIVLIEIPLTMDLINLLNIQTFMTKILILRNIKFPNKGKKRLMYNLIRLIETMKNLEVLDFSGFNICDIYQNYLDLNKKDLFAELFNNLILTLSGKLKYLNFTNNIINFEEYVKIFDHHVIVVNYRKYNEIFKEKTKGPTNIKFIIWNISDNIYIRIYAGDDTTDYRSININASPNTFVDNERVQYTDDDVVLVNRFVKTKINITGGRKIKNKISTKNYI